MANSEIVSELNKLKKQDLIEILINKKVPTQCTSETIIGFVENLFLVRVSTDISANSSDTVITSQLDIHKNDLALTNKLVFHLEQRIDEQSKIISFLTNRDNQKTHTKSNSKSTNKETSGYNKITSSMLSEAVASAENVHDQQNKNKTPEILKNKTNLTATDLTSGNPMKIDTSNKHENLVGAGNCDEKFMGVQQDKIKKSWLCVSRFKPDLSADDLLNYLSTTHKRNDFVCTKIIPKNVSNPSYSSFRVGVDISLEEALLKNPMLWPSEIKVTKYLFRRTFHNNNLQNF